MKAVLCGAVILGIGVLLGVSGVSWGQSESGQPPWAPTTEVHVVAEGDTLWDLSERFVGDPFLWPRLWALNPEISNPHWIYPGDQVRFLPSDLPLPSLSEVLLSEEDVDQIGGDEVASAPQQPSIEIVQDEAAQRSAAAASGRQFVGLFITDKELREAGTITNARPDRMILDVGDEVFVKLKGTEEVMKGTELFAYRTLRKVQHPVKHSSWGFVTEITGRMRIIKQEKKRVYSARVLKIYRELERGHLVTPVTGDPTRSLAVTQTQEEIEGFVLAVRGEMAQVVGTEGWAFIDRGDRDGVQVGNRFAVLAEDATAKGLSLTQVGILQVVDVKERASTCLVVKASREIFAGLQVSSMLQ